MIAVDAGNTFRTELAKSEEALILHVFRDDNEDCEKFIENFANTLEKAAKLYEADLKNRDVTGMNMPFSTHEECEEAYAKCTNSQRVNMAMTILRFLYARHTSAETQDIVFRTEHVAMLLYVVTSFAIRYPIGKLVVYMTPAVRGLVVVFFSAAMYATYLQPNLFGGRSTLFEYAAIYKMAMSCVLKGLPGLYGVIPDSVKTFFEKAYSTLPGGVHLPDVGRLMKEHNINFMNAKLQFYAHHYPAQITNNLTSDSSDADKQAAIAALHSTIYDALQKGMRQIVSGTGTDLRNVGVFLEALGSPPPEKPMIAVSFFQRLRSYIPFP
ncbi:hypothetical protein CYMTET_44356 [Cymbomonas tetramitiformis]|uniref:Uncharacterized protein n=1 Tax=Cymbomonas tetramitiformis TaxID=36881 RepID=A0AAE0C294_9CHLO|nr:hypothetical protein CYMTET_44356 [Cymbomonas tetramitiformis]